jgi:hypothetical protein
MTYFSKKKSEQIFSSFIFIFDICAKFQTKEKGLFMARVFERFQSHYHILKESHNFLHTMGAITIFGERIFIFSFVVIDW